jgi:leader peptidase (prepilin peptidase) / N-methyltransferase
MVIILIVIGVFLGVVEYYVIEAFSYIYVNNENKLADNCRTEKPYYSNLKNGISNVLHYSKPNKRNQLPFVIVITIILILISYNEFTLSIQFYRAVTLNIILTIISFIDIKSQNIPNIAVIFTALAASVFILLGNLSLTDSVCGMLIGGGSMWLISLIPGVLGGGDVKLMFALGLFLGFKGILNAMVIAFFLASFVSIGLLLLKKLGRKDVIAFGPFLAAGTIIVINFINK